MLPIIDTTISLNTILDAIICLVVFPVIVWQLKRNRRSHQLISITLDAAISTIFYSANGAGKDLKVHFDNEVDKAMKKKKFIDGD